MAKRRKYISKDQLLKIVQITDRTLKSWKGKGLPTYKKVRPHKYDAAAVKDWLNINGREGYALCLEEWENERAKKGNKKKSAAAKTENKRAEKKSRADVKPADVCGDNAEGIGEEEVAGAGSEATVQEFDIFQNKKLINGLTQKQALKLDGDPSVAEANVIVNTLTKLSDLGRKLELDCMEVDKALGVLAEFSEIKTQVARMAIAVKTDLRNRKYTMAEKIATLTDYDDISGLADMIGLEMDDALRHLSGDIKTTK